MKSFWDDRYSEDGFAYGREPNEYFKAKLDRLRPGRILLPAEGEGRNAVYAAKRGWQVVAFDQSDAGRSKALELARKHKVQIDYKVMDISHLSGLKDEFDAIALIYVHLHHSERRQLHDNCVRLLKHDGHLILEAFSKDHLIFNAVNPEVGGPRDPDMLYSLEDLNDFKALQIIESCAVNTHLDEGKYHHGEAAVIRCFALKL